MKTLKNFTYALIALCCGFAVSCSQDTTHEAGAPEVDGCFGVYFPEQDNTGDIEIDPTAALTYTYTVTRTNYDVEGEVIVPVEVVENTDDMYTVGDIVFGEGEETTQLTVTLSDKSEIGKKYTLTLDIVDDNYALKYGDKPTALSVSLTRVKWLEVGECDYTEDAVTSYWSFTFSGPYAGQSNPTYPVQVQVREDSIDKTAWEAAMDGTGSADGLVGTYRMVNAYAVGPWTGLTPAEALEEGYADYIVIQVDAADKVYIKKAEMGGAMPDILGGKPGIWSYVDYYLVKGETDPSALENITEEMYGFIKNGEIRFNESMLLINPGEAAGAEYADGSTFTSGGNYSGAWCLNLCEALNKYSLELPDLATGTDGDFKYSEVEVAPGTLFYSESQVASWEQPLEVGEPIVYTDNAHKEFAEQYGKLYRLPSLYTEGYHIYFCVNGDGEVVFPEDLAVQPTGMVVGGADIYVIIDGDKSSFDAKTGETVLSSTLVTPNGSEIMEYGTYTETLTAKAPEFGFETIADLKTDFSYRTAFKDLYKSGYKDDEWAAEFQVGTCANPALAAAFESAYGTAYCIPSVYAEGYNLYFCGDAEGKVSVPATYAKQPTGEQIYGKSVYAAITGGEVNAQGCTLKVAFVFEDGTLVTPTKNYTEKLVTYNWLPVSTGTYTTNLLTNEEGTEVEPVTGLTLAQAEGTNIYRIENFWGEEGYHLEFTWDSTTNKCDINGPMYTGLDYQAGAGIYAMDAIELWDWLGDPFIGGWEEAESYKWLQPYYDPATLTFHIYVSYAIPALGGAFNQANQYHDTFVLDGEPSVVEWEQVAVGSFTYNDSQMFKGIEAGMVEPNCPIYRYGETNKYKVAIINQQLELDFRFDAAKNQIEFAPVALGPGQDEGSIMYLGDAAACYVDIWESTKKDGTPLTYEDIYGLFPNTYDAATQTLTFEWWMFDNFGYVYGDNTYSALTTGVSEKAKLQFTGEPSADGGEVAPASMAVKSLSVVSTASRMMINNSKFVLFGARKQMMKREVTKMEAFKETTRIELPTARKSFVEVTPSKRPSLVRRANVEGAAMLM